MRPQLLGRRQFLFGCAATTVLVKRSSAFAQGGDAAIRIASNQGVENATLQTLMADRGFLGELGIEARIVESKSVSGPMEAMLADEADICMISGFVGYLPAIERGAPLRMVGSAMQLPALAVYTARDDIDAVADLAGRTVGVGPENGLLHVLMLALLRKKGVDASEVRFVKVGSNAQVMAAVAAGEVDAGLSGTAGLSNPAARVLTDGKLWQELPEYTYQPAYASLRAIEQNPHAVARCLAAYAELFRFLSGPSSRAAYLEARRRSDRQGSAAEGEAVWDFIQSYQPYALDVGVSPERVAYLQELNLAIGLQSRAVPFEQVADMRPAEAARRLLS